MLLVTPYADILAPRQGASIPLIEELNIFLNTFLLISGIFTITGSLEIWQNVNVDIWRIVIWLF